MATEAKKEGAGGFFKKLLSVEAPLKYGVLGSALFVGIAMLKAVLAPELFLVAEMGALVGAGIGLVNNLVSAASS